MKIKQKLTCAALGAGVLILIVGYLSIIQSKTITQYKTTVLPIILTIKEIEESIWEMNHAADSFKYTGSKYYEKQFNEQVKEVDNSISEYKELATTEYDTKYIGEFCSVWDEAKKAGKKMIELTKQQKKAEQELFINVDEADDVLDYQIQSKWSTQDPLLLLKEQAVREVEVSIWEAIHAAQQYTGLAGTIVRGNQKYLGTKLQAAKAAATASMVKGDFNKLMEAQFNDVEKFWGEYKKMPHEEFEKKAIAEFDDYWNKAVIAGRNLVNINQETNKQFNILYKKINRVDEIIDTYIQKSIQTKINSINSTADNYRKTAIGLTIFLFILSIFLALFFSRIISNPIINLSKTATRIMNEKDLTIPVPKSITKDEMNTLSNSLNKLIDSLRTQSQETATIAADLSSAISQISTSTTQLAAGSTESTTSITEISSTIEELKQISQNTYNKTLEVTEKSKKVAEIFREGQNATEKNIVGMNKINEEMNYIAQSTIRLGEQTQNIESIINSVSNLADQTNLLSVNASIEAAKAGEFGKGFAVVAKEVKALAHQSREATEQISTILTDIQKASSAAILAIERGNKAVKTGLELSKIAGDAIETLNNNIIETTDSSVKISISNQQQLSGMQQLFDAIENIRTALEQIQTAQNSLKNRPFLLQNLARNCRI